MARFEDYATKYQTVRMERRGGSPGNPRCACATPEWASPSHSSDS
jgi:hypothetical protein